MFVQALSAAILAAAALGIWGQYAVASKRWLAYCFRPLAGLLILWLAGCGDRAADPRYFWGIVAGLAFALVGDVLLMMPRDLFVHGLSGFAVTHVCFLWAFTSGTAFAAHPLPLVLYLLVSVALVGYIWTGVGPGLRLPVLAYVVLLVSMAGQAASRSLDLHSAPALLAAVGGGLFLGSDAVLSVDRFREPFPSARLVVLATFYAADWSIALSLHAG